jgi:hypothetical protein
MKVKLYTATAQVTITQPEILVSVSGIATNATLFCEADGRLLQPTVKVLPGNHKCNNDVVANTDLLLNIYPNRYATGGNEGQTVLLPLK